MVNDMGLVVFMVHEYGGWLRIGCICIGVLHVCVCALSLLYPLYCGRLCIISSLPICYFVP